MVSPRARSSGPSQFSRRLTVLAGLGLLAIFCFSVAGSSPRSPQASATSLTIPMEVDALGVEEAPSLDFAPAEPVAEVTAKPTVVEQMSNEYPVYELAETSGQKGQEEVSASAVSQEKPPTAKEDAQVHEHDDELFEDAEAYRAAPMITAPSESQTVKYRMIVLQHERYYKSHQSRLFVPRLRKTARLSIKEFAERFIRQSQPVVIPFDAMRHLGFKTRSFTLDDLLEKYPNYRRAFTYKYGSQGPGEMDLGPAVWALKQGDALRKTSSGRNFPRNTKVALDKISKLGVQVPPYILPGTPLLAPSLWFGTTTSSTKMHSDCCDNYAMMVSGTKRWTLTPPHEARLLHPVCTGGLCWVKQLEHPDEHASSQKQMDLRDKLQTVTFELGPDEMLYLPCGWFHHVENLGPTIMINFWTKGGPGFLRFLDGSAYKSSVEVEKEDSAADS